MKHTDPMMRQTKAAYDAGPLFSIPTSTSAQAGHRAASVCDLRWRQILGLLAVRDMAIFEVASALELEQSQISGRFGADDPGGLRYHGYIERVDGQQRTTPTGGKADVWQITAAGLKQLELLRRKAA